MTVITTVNPATNKSIQSYQCEDVTSLNAKLALAQAGYITWSQFTIDKRVKFLLKLSQILKQNFEVYAKLIQQEMGKPFDEGVSEVLKCSSLCEYYAHHAALYLKDELITIEGRVATVMIAPLGTVLGIMPWNYPFWQVLRAAIPIITSGNVFILKHAPNCTGAALAIADLFKQAHFPEGVFQAIIATPEASLNLLADASVIGVTFTGSERAGRTIASFAGLHLKRTVLELGGSDAAIILDDADISAAAAVVVSARLSNAGQVCIAPKRIIVTQKNAQAFIKAVIEATKSIKIGPMAREDLRAHIHQQVLSSINEGAKCHFGGEIPEGQGFFYPPTLLTDVSPHMTAAIEELFGPVIVIMTAKDESEAIAWANDSPYGLGASIFTTDLGKAQMIANRLEAGVICINDRVVSHPALPFGGIKHSGFGRELSKEGLVAFCNIKTVVRHEPF